MIAELRSLAPNDGLTVNVFVEAPVDGLNFLISLEAARTESGDLVGEAGEAAPFRFDGWRASGDFEREEGLTISFFTVFENSLEMWRKPNSDFFFVVLIGIARECPFGESGTRAPGVGSTVSK
jgi:hypothetical protein